LARPPSPRGRESLIDFARTAVVAGLRAQRATEDSLGPSARRLAGARRTWFSLDSVQGTWTPSRSNRTWRYTCSPQARRARTRAARSTRPCAPRRIHSGLRPVGSQGLAERGSHWTPSRVPGLRPVRIEP